MYILTGLDRLKGEGIALGSRVPPPTDYEDCYNRYIAYIKRTVAKNGIDWQEVDDVADEIYLRVMEKDLLAAYDPERVFQTESGPRKASFTAMLSSFVGKYCLNYKDRQEVRRRREPVRIEGLILSNTSGKNDSASDETAAEDRVWLHILDSTDEIDIEALVTKEDFRRAVLRAHEHLSNLPDLHARDRRHLLPALFRYCISKILLDGKMTRKEVAKHFGLSDTHVYHLFADLKAELRACNFAPGLI